MKLSLATSSASNAAASRESSANAFSSTCFAAVKRRAR
jgi:hypothetical protein